MNLHKYEYRPVFHTLEVAATRHTFKWVKFRFFICLFAGKILSYMGLLSRTRLSFFIDPYSPSIRQSANALSHRRGVDPVLMVAHI